MNIQISNGTYVQYYIPAVPVGVPGGVWSTHRYDSLGLNSHYPVYMDPSPNPYPGYSVIHVRSRVAQQFYFGDFFDVWGKTLGNSSTINRPAHDNYVWQMCLVTPTSQQPSFLWRQQPLIDGLQITLLFYDKTKLGCA